MSLCCCETRPTNNPRHKQRFTRRYMPTVRTVTVKSAGGDYSTLSSAEAGEQADLVALDRQLDIECYSMNDTTNVLISGWTTDATRYIRIFTPSGERHDGKWNTGKYNLVTGGANVYTFDNTEDYVRIAGLQIENTNNRSSIRISGTALAASSDMRIEDCVIRGGGLTGNNGIGTVLLSTGLVSVRNSVIYGSRSVGLVCSGSTAPVDNCTIAACTTYGISRSGGTLTLQNVYSGGNGTDDYTGAIASLTTCAHSSASVFTGSTASIAHDTTNFTNVTGGSEDYHLVSGASATLKTGGTDLSGTFTTDIDGETRSDWGIGADEIVAAPGGLAIPICMYHYVHHICGCSK